MHPLHHPPRSAPASSSIQIVKGAHYNFWSQTCKQITFNFNVIGKGYGLPLISAPPKAFFNNDTLALTHADFVGEAVQEHLFSGSIMESPCR